MCNFFNHITKQNQVKMDKKRLSNRCLSYIAGGVLMACSLSAVAQTAVEPLGLDAVSSDGKKASCKLSALTNTIVTAGGSAMSSPLSPLVSMRLEGVYVGVNEAEASSLVVWPNPAEDNLFVKSEAAVKSYAVADMNGRSVVSGVNGEDQEISISVSALAPGSYILQVSTVDGKKYSGKFIKK
ncbi:MAG: T9SS type A sorting domain-containing protein [Bacteroidales bacterium]|nr:T9SS type A sorting domain-containing protein [Bacteroidales bacterium]